MAHHVVAIPWDAVSRFDHCIPGWLGVDRLACRLVMVASLFLQQSGWCMVVLASLWSACLSLGPFCRCQRCRVLGCRVDNVCSVGSSVRRPACAQPVMVSRCVLRLALTGMSDGQFVVLRLRCGRRVVLGAIVVAAHGQLVGGCAGACLGLAGHALVVYPCVVVVLSPVLCMAGFVAVASSALPDGLLVPLSGVLVVGCGSVVVHRPHHGGASCAGVWPTRWWGVVPQCMAPLMEGRVVVVCDPPHGQACCVGVWPPSWWGLLWWCVAPVLVGRVVVVSGPPHGGAWCGGVWPPFWWGVLRCCVAPLLVGPGVPMCGPPHCRACCIGVSPSSWWG